MASAPVLRRRGFVRLLFLVLLSFAWEQNNSNKFCYGLPTTTGNDDSDVDDGSSDDETPRYESDESDDDVDDEYDDEYDDDDEYGTVFWESALVHSKNATKFLLRNRSKLTVALTVFAFRHEILAVLTSEAVGLNTPSNMVKLVLLLETARKLRSDLYGDDGGDGHSPTPLSLLQWLRRGGGDRYDTTYNPPLRQQFMFERWNDRYGLDGTALGKILRGGPPPGPPRFGRSSPALVPSSTSTTNSNSSTVVVVFEVKADVTMSQLPQLRDTVSFLLSVADSIRHNNTNNNTTTSLLPHHTTSLEVVVLLESPGGIASSYGLAAAQMRRLRLNDNTKLVVCVDTVAASGGYMMACQADELLAAPFALLGSIGVVAQAVNFHDVLCQNGVRPLTLMAPGHGKAPIGATSAITEEGLRVVQDMVDRTHRDFREFVEEGRRWDTDDNDNPDACTGEVWSGADAVRRGLVDRLVTSDEYVAERMRSGDTVVRLRAYDRGRPGLFGVLSRPPALIKSLSSLVEDAGHVVTTLGDLLEGRTGRSGVGAFEMTASLGAISSVFHRSKQSC